MFKKISLILCGLLVCKFLIQEVSFYQINEITSVGLSLSFSDQTCLNNSSQSNNLLRSLFVYSIYQEFVKEELRSFKSITSILSKPFVNFWIVNETIEFLSKQVLYLISEIRKLYCAILTVFVRTTLLFVFLFYYKTHLKTYRFTPMVLRC